MPRRQYSDEEKAQALAVLTACGGSLRAASKQTGVPIGTLNRWKNGQALVPDCLRMRTEKSKTLAEKFDAVANLLVEAMPGKIKDASLQAVATAAGIATDKARLLRGEPTVIEEQRMSEDERKQRLAELLDRGEDRARTQAPDAPGAGRGRPATPGAGSAIAN